MRQDQQAREISHSFCRAPRSFQIRSLTSLTLVPTSFALVPNSLPTSLTLVSTSFALVPDSQLTVAINRGQATTVLSEHGYKEQRKRTQRRSATMFAVFLLCVLRDNLCLTPAMAVRTWMIIVLRLYTRCQRRLKKTESNQCSAVAMWMVCGSNTPPYEGGQNPPPPGVLALCQLRTHAVKEVSDQHFENSSFSPFRDPHLLVVTPPNSLQTACQAARLKPDIRIFVRTTNNLD